MFATWTIVTVITQNVTNKDNEVIKSSRVGLLYHTMCTIHQKVCCYNMECTEYFFGYNMEYCSLNIVNMSYNPECAL